MEALVAPLQLTVKKLNSILTKSSQVLGKSAVVLGAAGFIGEAAAKLAPVDLLAHSLQVLNVPSWALLISLPDHHKSLRADCAYPNFGRCVLKFCAEPIASPARRSKFDRFCVRSRMGA